MLSYSCRRLSAARLFAREPAYSDRLVALGKEHASHVVLQWDANRKVPAHVVLSYLLNSFRGLHTLWSTTSILTDTEVTQYARHCLTFHQAWQALSWKVTPWVHWVAAHSADLVSAYRTIFLFSSIPTEARHKSFKRDLRHCCLVGRRKRPMRAAQGLLSLGRMDALDKGLQLYWKRNPDARPRKRSRR